MRCEQGNAIKMTKAVRKKDVLQHVIGLHSREAL